MIWLRDRLVGLADERRARVWATSAALAALFAVAVWILFSSDGQIEKVELDDEGKQSQTRVADDLATNGDSDREVAVHVAGAVRSPGVYRLRPGSRAIDAVGLAGGPADDADMSAINLASEVVDGGQILLPRVGEAVGGEASSAGGSAQAAAGGKVNINSADERTLQALPGVGPSIAAKIVAHRKSHGPFRRVEDLKKVPGIGEAKLAEIAPMATI